MKVRNMVSSRSGNPVANQFIINDDNGNTYFQSYDSIIVMIDSDGNTVLDEHYWDYSRTAVKYRNQFLGENTRETQANIDSGVYAFGILN